MRVKIVKVIPDCDNEAHEYYKSWIGRVVNVIGIDGEKLILDIPSPPEDYSYWGLKELEFIEEEDEIMYEYLNYEVRCTEELNGDRFIIGKKYKVIEGRLVDEKGNASLYSYADIESINKEFMSQFELVINKLPQPHNSLLKSGDKIVYRYNDERFVLLETGTLHATNGCSAVALCYFTDDLTWIGNSRANDIMEIWRGDKLIAKRIEKSEKEIEIESIESEMRKLADRLKEIKK